MTDPHDDSLFAPPRRRLLPLQVLVCLGLALINFATQLQWISFNMTNWTLQEDSAHHKCEPTTTSTTSTLPSSLYTQSAGGLPTTKDDAATHQEERGNEVQRTPVEFLNASDFRVHPEIYSGMWWQHKTGFMKINTDKVKRLEDASLMAFYQHTRKEGGIRLTRDWLDFSVEHLSKYVRHVAYYGKNVTKQRMRDLFRNYIDNALMAYNPNGGGGGGGGGSMEWELTVKSTIALLPIRASRHQTENDWLTLQLAATVASLWKVGIGRAVVVGLSLREQSLAENAFAALQEKIALHPMELAYVQIYNATKSDAMVVPRVALRGLQNAMQSTDPEIQQTWLGGGGDASDGISSRWNYVYFTEPDLLLYTRPSAFTRIAQVVAEGKLMVAHRLEPIPHQREYLDSMSSENLAPIVVPNKGVFAAIFTLGENDACCDEGKYYPANRADPRFQFFGKKRGKCAGIWVHCGFNRENMDYQNQTLVLDAHQLLVGYPVISTRSGTGLPLVASNQRMCVPNLGSAGCPAPSG